MDDEDDNQIEGQLPCQLPTQRLEDYPLETSIDDELDFGTYAGGVFDLLHQGPQQDNMAKLSARDRRKISQTALYFYDDPMLQESVYIRGHTVEDRIYDITRWTGMEDILHRVASESASNSGLSGNTYPAAGHFRRVQKSDASSQMAAQREQLRRTTHICIDEPLDDSEEVSNYEPEPLPKRKPYLMSCWEHLNAAGHADLPSWHRTISKAPLMIQKADKLSPGQCTTNNATTTQLAASTGLSRIRSRLLKASAPVHSLSHGSNPLSGRLEKSSKNYSSIHLAKQRQQLRNTLSIDLAKPVAAISTSIDIERDTLSSKDVPITKGRFPNIDESMSGIQNLSNNQQNQPTGDLEDNCHEHNNSRPEGLLSSLNATIRWMLRVSTAHFSTDWHDTNNGRMQGLFSSLKTTIRWMLAVATPGSATCVDNNHNRPKGLFASAKARIKWMLCR